MTRRGFFAASKLHGSTPDTLIPKCSACGLMKTCRSPKMPVTGKGGRKILLLGEAPGEDEDLQNRQFVGKSGKRLATSLRRVGIDMTRDCWLTNALICRPPNNANPTPEQIRHCRPNLLKTLETLKPDIIIPLGKWAVASLIGHIWKDKIDAITPWVGWCIPSTQLNAWVCPNYHPSYVCRAEGKPNQKVIDLYFEEHLRRASRLNGPPWPNGPHDWGQDVDIIMDTDRAAIAVRQMMARGGMVAFDYETNMLKPDSEDARIVSCSLCWRGKKTIAFPWHGEARVAVSEFLRSPVPKIASNMKFEDRWTRKEFGHRVRGWFWDTMLGAHFLDNRRGITSIKFQAFVRLGVPAWNDHIEPHLKTKGDKHVNQILRQIDMHDLLLYNSLDSLYEYKVAELQLKEAGFLKESEDGTRVA